MEAKMWWKIIYLCLFFKATSTSKLYAIDFPNAEDTSLLYNYDDYDPINEFVDDEDDSSILSNYKNDEDDPKKILPQPVKQEHKPFCRSLFGSIYGNNEHYARCHRRSLNRFFNKLSKFYQSGTDGFSHDYFDIKDLGRAELNDRKTKNKQEFKYLADSFIPIIYKAIPRSVNKKVFFSDSVIDKTALPNAVLDKPNLLEPVSLKPVFPRENLVKIPFLDFGFDDVSKAPVNNEININNFDEPYFGIYETNFEKPGYEKLVNEYLQALKLDKTDFEDTFLDVSNFEPVSDEVDFQESVLDKTDFPKSVYNTMYFQKPVLYKVDFKDASAYDDPYFIGTFLDDAEFQDPAYDNYHVPKSIYDKNLRKFATSELDYDNNYFQEPIFDTSNSYRSVDKAVFSRSVTDNSNFPKTVQDNSNFLAPYDKPDFPKVVFAETDFPKPVYGKTFTPKPNFNQNKPQRSVDKNVPESVYDKNKFPETFYDRKEFPKPVYEKKYRSESDLDKNNIEEPVSDETNFNKPLIGWAYFYDSSDRSSFDTDYEVSSYDSSDVIPKRFIKFPS